MWTSRVYGPNRGPWAILLWGVLLPAFAIMVLFFTIQDLVPTASAVVGRGERGTFTATKKDCRGKPPCTWEGKWTSKDGKRHRPYVRLAEGDSVDRVGDRLDALDSGSRVNVYASRPIANTLLIIVFILGSLGLLALCGRVLRDLRREHLQRRR